MEILKGHDSKDHIHLFVSVPPKLSVSKLMQYLKGKHLIRCFLNLSIYRDSFGVKHIWARGYFAVSSGNVTDEVIMKYIENQDLESEDDNFQINHEL